LSVFEPKGTTMSLWDESQWVQGYIAKINHVFAGGDSAQIDFSWEALEAHQGTGRVGWRSLAAEDSSIVAAMLTIATHAKENDWRLKVRVTNDGRITALQTVTKPRDPRSGLEIGDLVFDEDRVHGIAVALNDD
jgi:hypothetical protein